MNLGDLIAAKKKVSTSVLILFILFIVLSVFVLSFPYPIGRQQTMPNFPEDFGENIKPNNTQKQPISSEIWTGGTNPDEAGYFGWAYLYYKTGKTYIPLEDVGPNKVQQQDFYIGESPETCIFVRVEVSRYAEESLIWSSGNRNVTIVVYDGNGKGLGGVRIEVTDDEENLSWSGFSGEDGKFAVNVPPGRYIVSVNVNRTKEIMLKTSFYTDYSNFNYPIMASVNLKKWAQEHVEVSLHIDHYFNPNLGDADVYLSSDEQKSKFVGRTNAEGNYTLILPKECNIYQVTVVKDTGNIFTPPGSVVVKVDGKWVVANRWAPGYCYLIIPFWISGQILFINIFMCVVTSISTYFIARRLYDDKIGIVSTILVMVCGIGMVMMYARGMADYAAMAFATAGMALSLESIQNHNRGDKMILRLFLGFLGGLSIAFAITIRYSTAIILIAPLIYLFIKFIRNVKKYPAVSIVKKGLVATLPFILGLIVIGCLLASYNTHLFGGPLNSGYQMGHVIGTENGNVTVETTEKTMFEQYFNPSLNTVSNIFNRILPQLYCLLPTLFIALLGLFLDFRRERCWLLLLWIIPVLIIYMQLGWVGQVPVEDMRYFLPVLPPTAILSAYAINQSTGMADKQNKIFLILPLALIVVSGFMMGWFGISWEISRQNPIPPLLGVLLLTITYFLLYWRVINNAIKKQK